MPKRVLTARDVWRVLVPSHTVAGRYPVPESVEVRYESDRRAAVAHAVRTAHIRAEVPPWKPFLRETARLVSVERGVVDR